MVTTAATRAISLRPRWRRIAVFRALQLGDMLCAVPALRALRAAWPDARITLIGLPWAQDLVDRIGYVDDFIDFPGYPGLPEQTPRLAELPAFFTAVQARSFDLAIQLHGSGAISNPLTAAFGAAELAGFFVPGAWCPDARRFLPWPDAAAGADLQPEVRRLLALTSRLGAPAQGEYLELPTSDAERAAGATLRAGFALDRAYVCVHAGARWPSRRWPAERFAAVADRLAAAGLTVVLTGSADEAPLLARVRALMKAPAMNLSGRTTLGSLATLVADAALVVCNDTGISHVAAAVGTPSVVISCGADVQRWRPLDDHRHRVLAHDVACRPCAEPRCPTRHECAAGIGVDAVFAQARALLAAGRGAH